MRNGGNLIRRRRSTSPPRAGVRARRSRCGRPAFPPGKEKKKNTGATEVVPVACCPGRQDGPDQAFLASSTRRAKAAVSFTARSASILRFTVMLAFFRPPMKAE